MRKNAQSPRYRMNLVVYRASDGGDVDLSWRGSTPSATLSEGERGASNQRRGCE
jgi:hypothetical protein